MAGQHKRHPATFKAKVALEAAKQTTLQVEHWSLHRSHLISRYRVKIEIKLHEVIVCRSDNEINRRKTLRKPHGNHY
jgi:hypothetical protein